MRPEPNLREILADDHRAISELLEEMREAARAAADWRTIVALWKRLVDRLEAHLRTEERHLFPPLEHTHVAEIARLKDEHAALRKRIDEITTGVELHQVRDATLESFLDELASHAGREDAQLYRWAQAELIEDDAREARRALRERAPGASA
jgi:hemerythrin